MKKQSYYEILEVDKNASQEVIKKAYNTLAKKYHPDLQKGDMKNIYSEKLKLINEAYSVLSKEDSRKEYDESFVDELDSLKQRINELVKENERLRNEFKNGPKTSASTMREAYNKAQSQREFEKAKNDAIQQAYYDAYINDMQNRGYNVNSGNSNSIGSSFKNIIAILVTLTILYLLWKIPFIRDFIVKNLFP